MLGLAGCGCMLDKPKIMTLTISQLLEMEFKPIFDYFSRAY